MSEFKGSGGTVGGVWQYLLGFALAAVSVYLFFDSVRMTTGHHGWMTGWARGGWMETTSMAIVFLPFGIGVWALFVNAQWKWAKWLTYIGIAVIAIEILSRVHFYINIKTTHFIGILVSFCAGTALMFRSYMEKDGTDKNEISSSEKTSTEE